MGKHINKANSVIICRLYKEYKGKWDKIMANAEIKAMGYQRNQIEHHLSYKKRQLPKKKDAKKHDRGDKAREKVFKMLERLDDSDKESLSSDSYDISSSQEETSLASIRGRKIGQGKTPTRWFATFTDGEERWERESYFVGIDGATNPIFEGFEEEHPNEDDVQPPQTKKRPNSDPVEEKEKATKKPKLKRQLSDASMHLEELNKELLSTSVASSDIQSIEDIQKVKTEAQEMTKRDVRSSRIAEKEKESKAIVANMKKHQETTESQANMQSTMQMMGLQMLQKMMKDNETEDEIQKVEKEMGTLKTELSEVKDEIKGFANTLTGIENTQAQLMASLNKLSEKV